jgi:hypothetical protein
VEHSRSHTTQTSSASSFSRSALLLPLCSFLQCWFCGFWGESSGGAGEERHDCIKKRKGIFLVVRWRRKAGWPGSIFYPNAGPTFVLQESTTQWHRCPDYFSGHRCYFQILGTGYIVEDLKGRGNTPPGGPEQLFFYLLRIGYRKPDHIWISN